MDLSTPKRRQLIERIFNMSYFPEMIKLVKKLGGQIVRKEKIMLGENERYFIEVKKIRPTSKDYPRENGMPKMKPLQ